MSERWFSCVLLSALACSASGGGSGNEATSTGEEDAGLGTLSNLTSETGSPGDEGSTLAQTSEVASSGESTTGCEAVAESSSGAGEICGPDPAPGWRNVRLADEKPKGSDGEVLIDSTCTVEDVLVEKDVATYALLCEENGPSEHLIELWSEPVESLPFSAGENVQLLVAKEYPIDAAGYEFIALRDEEGELAVAKYGPHRGAYPSMVDVEPWFAPLAFELLADLCPAAPSGIACDDGCQDQITRMALEFELGADTLVLYSDTVGTIGPYSLRVRSDYVENCTASPFDSVEWTAIREAGG